MSSLPFTGDGLKSFPLLSFITLGVRASSLSFLRQAPRSVQSLTCALFSDVLPIDSSMWSYLKSLKYYVGVLIEIIHVIIQAVSQYIFSITEKNIRNEIVLITGAGRGLGRHELTVLQRLIFSFFRTTNGVALRQTRSDRRSLRHQ